MSRPPSEPTPPERFDPWAPRNRGRALRFIIASTGAHAVVLVLLATITVQLVRKVEQIRVKVMEDAPIGPDSSDGQPSLTDLAGVLQVARAQPQQARPSGPRIQNIKAPELPRLSGVGPKIGTGPTVDKIAPLSFGSGGAGAIGGLGGGFGDYVGGLRKSGLDIALVIDTTDSMQFAIDEVKERLTVLVATLQRMVPATRVGIVVYRDKGDDYVTKWTDLSFKTEKLREFLSHIDAAGGGDWEEAVLEGIEAAINDLSWRKNSKRIIVVVGGSPPHPWDMDAIRNAVDDFHDKGGRVSTVDVTQRLHEVYDRFMWRSLKGSAPYQPSPMPEYYKETAKAFQDIAKSGGGEMMSLNEDKALIREVLILTFGGRWKVEMAKFMKELS